ncbi:MAG: serine--tRNA ligase [Bauldia sp.]|uniref:serine--tRNA ligase n=1 Tax=Bauldia sp. TaxID=2575872 RepID=UPI001DCB305B|nr:serine--tRNA ligase [Bauldia sp.]MCB1495336.1 serine--tRNA ligase [Bauldia sp.]
MLDIKWIRENPEALDTALKNRNAEPAAERLIALDEARRAHIVRLEEAQARRNAASKEIGAAKASGEEMIAQQLMAEVGELKAFLQEAEGRGRELDGRLDEALALIPNLPLDDVPVGPDESANVEHARWGTKPRINNAREHYELGEGLGQMDFETAAKLSGSRFVVLRKGLARMERALGQFMLDLHTTEHGYEEVQPPLLVRDEVMFGTAQLPKFVDDQFLATRTITRTELLREALRYASEEDKADYHGGRITLDGLVERTLERAPLKEDFWLVPTAEVPLTNLVRDSILSEEELPLRFTALTPCFRAEAGAAGKDTRGMLRQHQFDKVELVSITTPEQSRDEHERLITCAEEVLKRLDIHFRTMTLSTGDMGFGAQKTYDIEAWLPGQGQYREISSCSVCGDFQARRMKARYRPKEGKGTRLVHTLNGSGVAVGRALIAVMENYQNPDGSITVPDVLRPYLGGIERIEA